MKRLCKSCKKEKGITDFYKFKSVGKKRRRLVCKECDKERIRKWQEEHKDRVNASKRTSYQRRKSKVRRKMNHRYATDKKYRKELLAESKSYRHSPKGKATANRRRKRNKDAAFEAYGGYKCRNCGVTNPAVLSIDHEGGRKKHNHARIIRGDRLYSWLKTHNYPSGFRVLCFNCNILDFRESRQRW